MLLDIALLGDNLHICQRAFCAAYSVCDSRVIVRISSEATQRNCMDIVLVIRRRGAEEQVAAGILILDQSIQMRAAVAPIAAHAAYQVHRTY